MKLINPIIWIEIKDLKAFDQVCEEYKITYLENSIGDPDEGYWVEMEAELTPEEWAKFRDTFNNIKESYNY